MVFIAVNDTGIQFYMFAVDHIGKRRTLQYVGIGKDISFRIDQEARTATSYDSVFGKFRIHFVQFSALVLLVTFNGFHFTFQFLDLTVIGGGKAQCQSADQQGNSATHTGSDKCNFFVLIVKLNNPALGAQFTAFTDIAPFEQFRMDLMQSGYHVSLIGIDVQMMQEHIVFHDHLVYFRRVFQQLFEIGSFRRQHGAVQVTFDSLK